MSYSFLACFGSGFMMSRGSGCCLVVLAGDCPAGCPVDGEAPWFGDWAGKGGQARSQQSSMERSRGEAERMLEVRRKYPFYREDGARREEAWRCEAKGE